MYKVAPLRMAQEDSWQCQKCGKRGEFKLLDKGLVKCTTCEALHFVEQSGELLLCSEHNLGEKD